MTDTDGEKLSSKNSRKGLAIASLVLGICGLPTLGLCGVGSLVGLAFGIFTLALARKKPSRAAGRGLAIAGIATNVVSLILAAAIIAPSLLTTKLAVNESSAVSTLLSIHEAETSLRSKTGTSRYGTLQELAAAGLIDSDLASGSRNGYRFAVRVSGDYFEAFAVPSVYGSRWGFSRTGIRSFYIDTHRIVHSADKKGDEANSSDPAIY